MDFGPMRKSALAAALAAALTMMPACGGHDNGTGNPAATARTADGGKKTVNIGVTYSPGVVNPLTAVGMVSTQVTSLMFLPLVELDSDLTYKPMLADSIETSDNKTFTVKLNPRAKWTDGAPVTADDVIFTLELIANPKVGSRYAYMFAILEGLDDEGRLPEGRTSIAGVQKADSYTLTLTTKAPTTLNNFKDTIGRNLKTLPRFALENIPPEDLNESEFMRKPTVTNGPFKLVSLDLDHFVQLEANKDYFKGAPKLDELNFKVLPGTAVSAQLQNGEIDMNIPSAGVIPIDDYEKIKGLRTIATVSGPPLAAPFMYINEKVVPDAKTRQAISYAMNRELIVGKLLKGAGEAVDGFFTSYSPYRDESLRPVAYDPKKAKRLLKESGWDSGKTLTMSVLSGDSTLEQAANLIAENLTAAGFNVQIRMTDLSALLEKLFRKDYDLAVLTVALTPVNPLPDIAYFLQDGNPTGYRNEEIEKLLSRLAAETDESKIKEDYARLQQIVAEDVPMPSIYATKALGAVNDRVTGATPKDFGMFINVNEWDVRY